MRAMLALFLLLPFTPDAHAYLDPGSGSAILQGVLGGLAALALTLKLYWHRLLRFFGLRKRSESEQDHESRSETQSDSKNA